MAQAVPLDPSGVEILATPNAPTYEAPTTNAALQLAQSLSDVEPKVSDLVGQIGAQFQARAQAEAHGAALKSSATSFKDAVAKGDLQAGQSPWFVQAFNQDRAQLGSQQATQALVAQSQSWAEKSYEDGGVAYEQRLQQELGNIHQQVSQVPGMHPQDAEVGFQRGAAPVAAQAIAQNNQYQLQSIKLQKTQDNTSLMTQGILSAQQANPNASPSDLLKALDPIIARGASVGFQVSELKQQAFNSIVGAAFSAKDSSLLNLADAGFQGGPPLSSIAGDDGKPYGEQLGYAQYRIEQEANAAANSEAKGAAMKAQADGAQMVSQLKQQLGYAAFHMSPSDFETYAQQHGFSPDAYSAAARQMDREVEGITGLTKNFIAQNDSSPQAQAMVLSLKAEAAQKGLIPEVTTKINRAVASGAISLPAGESLIAEGASTTREAANTGRQVAAQDRATARQATHDAFEQGAQVREQNNQQALNGLIEKGDGGAVRDPTVKSQIERVGSASHDGWLAAHPGDYQGASDAQKRALATIITRRLTRLHPPQPAGTGTGLAQKGN